MTDIIKRDQRETPLRRSLYDESPESDWQDPLHPRRLVGKLLKRKRLIASVFATVFIGAAVATYMTTPLYKSTTIVQVNADPVQVLPYRDVADAAGGGNYDNYMGTQEQLLKGSGLMDRVTRRLNTDFKGQPVSVEASRLIDRYALKKVERSDLFELSYLAPSPEAAETVANLFAEEFVKYNFEMRQATRVKAEKDLQQELKGLEERLQLSEKDLMTYAQSNNILSLEQGQVDPLQERLRSLNQAVAEAETSVSVSAAAFQTTQATTVEAFPQRLVSQQISELEGTLLQLDQELTTLRTKFGENWPAVVEKRNEAVLVRQQLEREKGSSLARQLEQARLDLQGSETRRRLALQDLADQKVLVNAFHDASIRYNILKREVDTNRNLYDGLLERLRQTGVMAGFQFGNIQVVTPGRRSRVADSPKVGWILGLAALLGLALGVCLSILMDFWDNSISTLEEAEQLAPLPTLGSIPLIKATKSVLALLPARGKTTSAAGSLPSEASGLQVSFEVTESFRAVCASILLSRSDQRPRVIVVTSATASEGKTTLVTNLGKAFAEAGSSTLMIEADLRKPDLSKAFSIGNEDGLSLYLAGQVSPWPKIHETDIPNLFIAAAGPVPPNPAALLHSERLSLFLEAAATDYSVVLVDAPPLSFADARILGTKADGVVLVVRAGQTPKNLVRRAGMVLEASGANVLGVVLNGEEAESTGEYYRYYQYSHG